MTAVQHELKDLKRARVRKELADLDYRRQLVIAVTKAPQSQVAAELGLSQPSVSSALKAARTVPMPRQGSTSASPYEVCQRYAAGELTRDEAWAQLIAWPYITPDDVLTSPGDDLMIIPPGTVHELLQAKRMGLIDAEFCHGVIDVVYGRA